MSTDTTTTLEPPEKTNDGGTPPATLGAPASTDAVPAGGSEPQATAEPAAPATPPQTAPDAYDIKVEGLPADSSVVKAFGESARDAKLTQEQAQAMLDKLHGAMASDQQSRTDALRSEWHEAVLADKEIGGDKVREHLATARRAYERFASPALRDLLKSTGLEGHPEVIRAFHGVGRAMSDDRVVGEGEGGTTGFTKGSAYGDLRDAAAAKLYPTSVKKV